MTPDRELDALVATKVMGWRRMSYTEAKPGCSYPSPERLTGYWHSEDLEEQARAEDCSDYYAPEEAWSPSTDIAAAWEIVEKLGLCIGKNEVYPDLGEWVCLQNAGDGESWLFDDDTGSYAPTAPHAICLAALKAVGVEV